MIGFAAGMLGAWFMVAVGGASFEQRPKSKTVPRAAEVVTAKEFRLVDAAGTIRGSWHADDDGSTTLTVYRRKDKPGIILTIQGNDTPALFLMGEENTSASLVVLRGTNPAVSLKSPSGVVDLGINKQNRPGIEVRDPSQQVLFQSNR